MVTGLARRAGRKATMNEQLEREVAERLFAAWERWDLDTVGSLVAEDAVD